LGLAGKPFPPAISLGTARLPIPPVGQGGVDRRQGVTDPKPEASSSRACRFDPGSTIRAKTRLRNKEAEWPVFIYGVSKF